MLGICQHVCTEHPWPSFRVQGKTGQGMCRVWRAQESPLKKEEVSGTKEGIPVTWTRCCQELIRSGMSLYIFHLVKLVNISQFTPWIILDHPRLISSEPLLSQMKCHSSCLLYNCACVKQLLTLLYNVFMLFFTYIELKHFKLWTLNKLIKCLYIYMEFGSVCQVSLMSRWIKWLNTLTLERAA